jgi:hypothetical protein
LQFWEWKKPPGGAGTFFPLPKLKLLHAGNFFRSLEHGLLHAVSNKFRKSLITKMSGKTAGASLHGEEKSRTSTFSANSYKK